MSDIVVDVDKVSMMFHLSSERIDSLKEYVVRLIKRTISYEEFWALSDISFQIKQGESVGIVGLNGSGKSTLLKLIAGVMKPTLGRITTTGSIMPLIELGAGFDGDLTARENVFLNGAMLGYTRKEMTSFYDEIVDFSELGHFMDVPIKNYSSGMLSRLAFSIATIGKPDIVIVDEVLSVGDFKFQEKCAVRLQALIDANTTLLFVSHNIDQVEMLCERVIWLENGKVKADGSAAKLCPSYKGL